MSRLKRTWLAPALLALSLSTASAQSPTQTLTQPSAQLAFASAPEAQPVSFSTSASSGSLPEADPLPNAPQAAALKPDQAHRYNDVEAIDFPTKEQRRSSFLYDLIGPRAFLGAAVSALVDQASELKVSYPSDGFPGPGKHPAHGTVPEWSQGLPGYGRRFGSEFGIGFISVASKYTIGEALHQDVTYHACDCPGRPIHRFIHLFVASYAARTEHGRAVPSIPILVSPYIASEAAVHIWYPTRFNSSDALRISLSGLYTLPIRNFLAEYGNH